MQDVFAHNKRVRAFSLTNGLLGAWLIVAPFVTDEPSRPLAASAVVAGALVNKLLSTRRWAASA